MKRLIEILVIFIIGVSAFIFGFQISTNLINYVFQGR